MRSFWGVLGLLVIALTGGPAWADDERVPEAQRRFEAGMARYHLEEYDKAIEEWEAGYRAKPAPQFLYNLAQAYRLSKRPEKALSFYQKYLKLEPTAANRAEVERHIAALSKIVESQRQAAERPSTQPMPLPKAEPTPAQATTAPVSSAPASSAASSTTTAESPRGDLVAAPAHDKPVYKKGWFWGVLAGGAVVVAGAVTLGVLLSRPASEQQLPVGRF